MVLLFCCIATAIPSDPNSKPTHDVAITNVSVPSNCIQGETVPITVSLSNQGTRRETFCVKLTEDASSKEIASRKMVLGKGWRDGSGDVADLVFDPTDPGMNYFGNQVWMERDVNGDSIDDILISAPNWNDCRGQVYLYFGGGDINPSSPNLVFSGADPNTHLGGYAGTCSADINNDGHGDVVIGARGTHGYDGRVYIFYGGPKMDTQADMTLDGETGQGGNFGLTVTSGDIDNDGYEDILVGAQMYDRGRGRVYLFWGGEPMDTTADIILEGEGYPDGEPIIGYGSQRVEVQGWFGRKIAASGDINGDGYKEILVGARHAFDRNYNGSAYLFFGNTKQKMDGLCDCVFRGEKANEQMGSSVELFDIDNDGFSDVIVGARYARGGRGCVYVYWGKNGFSGQTPDLILQGDPLSNMGGDDIACGHFNHDRYADLLIGAYNYPDATTRRGRAYVFYGSDRLRTDTWRDYVFEGEHGPCYQYFGVQLSTGDINNDGYADALIGGPGHSDIQGRAYLYYGPFESSAEITFYWDTTNVSPGKNTLKAAMAPVGGEEDVADNTMTKTIEVKDHSKVQ